MTRDYDRLIEKYERELISIEEDLDKGIISWEEYKEMRDGIEEDIKKWERLKWEEDEEELMKDRW